MLLASYCTFCLTFTIECHALKKTAKIGISALLSDVFVFQSSNTLGVQAFINTNICIREQHSTDLKSAKLHLKCIQDRSKRRQTISPT
jgi:hypothetical protein